MPKLRNINPMGQVDVPVLGRQGEPFGEEGRGCLEPGEVIEVADAIAGRAPQWRPATEEDGLGDEVNTRFETRIVDDLLEVHDLGFGLLAQVDNYELVTEPKKKG